MQKKYYILDEISYHRDRFLQDRTNVNLNDLGAGQRKGSNVRRSVRDIAIKSSTGRMKGHILFHLSKNFKANHILELGTNLGLGSSYIYGANPKSEMWTVEGDKSLSIYANDLFRSLNFSNVKVFNQDFDSFMNEHKEYISKVDLAYIDGNHNFKFDDA